jgi:Ca2+-binding protein (EF-Hand superfamily)
MEITSTIEDTLLNEGKLTKNQIDQIREMFILMDADKSGTLSYEEVAKLMGKLANSKIIIVHCSRNREY